MWKKNRQINWPKENKYSDQIWRTKSGKESRWWRWRLSSDLMFNRPNLADLQQWSKISNQVRQQLQFALWIQSRWGRLSIETINSIWRNDLGQLIEYYAYSSESQRSRDIILQEAGRLFSKLSIIINHQSRTISIPFDWDTWVVMWWEIWKWIEIQSLPIRDRLENFMAKSFSLDGEFNSSWITWWIPARFKLKANRSVEGSNNGREDAQGWDSLKAQDALSLGVESGRLWNAEQEDSSEEIVIDRLGKTIWGLKELWVDYVLISWLISLRGSLRMSKAWWDITLEHLWNLLSHAIRKTEENYENLKNRILSQDVTNNGVTKKNDPVSAIRAISICLSSINSLFWINNIEVKNRSDALLKMVHNYEWSEDWTWRDLY